MGTYILTWNAALWLWDPKTRLKEARRTEGGTKVQGRRSFGRRTHDISPGDRAFLLRQGALRAARPKRTPPRLVSARTGRPRGRSDGWSRWSRAHRTRLARRVRVLYWQAWVTARPKTSPGGVWKWWALQRVASRAW